LGESTEADATGRLAEAYAFEVAPLVRRAIVQGLAQRRRDTDAPERFFVLKKATRIDPDREVRETAVRALLGRPSRSRVPARMDLAWIRLATADGGPPHSTMAGMVLRADGLAVPVAFDSDGYVLMPIPPGPARLLLEPSIPAYEGASHE
jgi:hypothetical protein